MMQVVGLYYRQLLRKVYGDISVFFLSLFQKQMTCNTKSNDLRKNISLRKSEVSVERISVCKAIENLSEQGIQWLLCSYTNDVIDLLS